MKDTVQIHIKQSVATFDIVFKTRPSSIISRAGCRFKKNWFNAVNSITKFVKNFFQLSVEKALTCKYSFKWHVAKAQ